MKRILLLFGFVLMMTPAANAQVNKHALGVRLNGGYYSGAELSYQMGLSDRNRFEFDAGSRFNGWGHRHLLTVCFHWDFNIVSGFNWFIGPGVQTGFYFDYNDANDNRFLVAVGGQGGVEFDFSVPFEQVPLLVSVDVRPMFDLFDVPHHGYWAPTGSLSARYIFK